MSHGASPVVGRRLLIVAIAAALVGGLFALSFTYAAHSPTPHDIRVAVVAPPRVVATVSRGLDRAAPGAFDVIASPSASAARAALTHQRIRGVLVLQGSGPAQVLVAQAAGTGLAQAVQAALTSVARSAGRSARVLDVVPLPAHDRLGITAYFLEIAMLLPSVLGSAALYLVGIRSRVWWRVAAAVLFAVLVGGLGMVVADPLLGALTGPWLATWGILSLGALAFVLCVAAAQASFGLAATGLAALAFIFVGNAVAGGSVPTGMLPDVYRQISPVSPNAAIVHAIRALAYFGGHGVGGPLLVLALWAGAGLYVLVLNDLLHLAAGRDLVAERRPEVYATPGVVHASRMIRGARAEPGP